MTTGLPRYSKTTVDRLAQTSIETLFSDYIEKRHPVILSNAAVDWPGLPDWSAETLRQRCGHKKVRISNSESTLAEVLLAAQASTEANPSPYLVECSLEHYLPELLQEVQPLPYEARNRIHAAGLPDRSTYGYSSVELLVGGAGTRFPRLHYDFQHAHAIITQLRGDKTFWLYSPDQTPFMYARQSPENVSQIDTFDPVDLQRWPRFAEATPLVVTLREGETIFVPSGWWHRTQLLTFSVALTWNLVSRSNWDAHVQDRFLRHTPSPARRALKKAYYQLIGAGLRLRGR